MDVIVETVPGGGQNEHVVVESPHGWLPQGARVFLEPDMQGGYDNRLLFEGRHYPIANIRVVDGHQPERTRTAFEVRG